MPNRSPKISVIWACYRSRLWDSTWRLLKSEARAGTVRVLEVLAEKLSRTFVSQCLVRALKVIGVAEEFERALCFSKATISMQTDFLVS